MRLLNTKINGPKIIKPTLSHKDKNSELSLKNFY